MKRPRPYISKVLRQKIATEAKHRCGYCLTPQSFTATLMQIDHIIPVAAGGPSTEDNLCLACPHCNSYKQDRTHQIDPLTGEKVSLFNPRQQTWGNHFRWGADGIEIIGITACGCATVVALKLNHSRLIQARRRWVSAGWHPPKDLQ